MFTGTIYKFSKTHGYIKPDRYGSFAGDILFDKREYDFLLSDRVTYEQYEKNNRKYAYNIEKI
jgi:hypothetical protein